MFPFSEGSSSPFSEIESQSNPVSMTISRSGTLMAVSLGNTITVVQCKLGLLGHSTDSCTRSSVFTPPTSYTLLGSFVQIVDKTVQDPLRIITVALSPRGESAICVFSSQSVVPTMYPISGRVTCAAAVPSRRLDSAATVVGTGSGSVVFLSVTGMTLSEVQAGEPVIGITCDTHFVFVLLASSVVVFNLVPPPNSRPVDIVQLPSSLDNPRFIVRPVSRSADQYSSPPPSPKMAPVGSLFVASETCMCQISLETKRIVTEPIVPDTDGRTTQVLFGPFDNGPVISMSDSGQLIGWESGTVVRVSSRIKMEGMVCTAVSPARDFPRLWTLRSEKGGMVLTSLGLRAGATKDRHTCI